MLKIINILLITLCISSASNTNIITISEHRYVEVNIGDDSLLEIDGYTYQGDVYWDTIGDYEIVYNIGEYYRTQIVHIYDNLEEFNLVSKEEIYTEYKPTNYYKFKMITDEIIKVFTISNELSNDILIEKYDTENNLILSEVYEFENEIVIKNTIIDSFGNIVIVGEINYYGSSVKNGFFMIVDLSLNVKKYIVFDEGISCYFNDIIEYENGYILIGGKIANEEDLVDAWVIKLSYKANVIFNKLYSGNSIDYFIDIEKQNDEVYLIGNTVSTGGYFSTYKLNDFDSFICKIDSVGNIIDLKYLKGTLNDYLIKIKVFNDKIYLIGKTYSNDLIFGNNPQNNSSYLMEIDEDINVIDITYISSEYELRNFYYFDNKKILLYTKLFMEILDGEDYEFYSSKIEIYGNNDLILEEELLSENGDVFVTNIGIIDNLIEFNGVSSVCEVNNRELTCDNTHFDMILNTYDFINYDLNNFKTSDAYIKMNNDNLKMNVLSNGDDFNENMFGEYELTLVYKDDNIDYQKDINIVIPLITNVEEYEVLNEDFELQFNGIGYLDNKPIDNNYIVKDVGNHFLELYGSNGAKKTINFEVISSEISDENVEETTKDIFDYIDQIILGSLILILLGIAITKFIIKK